MLQTVVFTAAPEIVPQKYEDISEPDTHWGAAAQQTLGGFGGLLGGALHIIGDRNSKEFFDFFERLTVNGNVIIEANCLPVSFATPREARQLLDHFAPPKTTQLEEMRHSSLIWCERGMILSQRGMILRPRSIPPSHCSFLIARPPRHRSRR